MSDEPFRGVLLGVDGSAAAIQRPAHQDTLQWLYEQIGCRTVEVVTLTPALDMWLDEEGLMTADARVNWQATAVAGGFGALAQPLYGNAVLLGGCDEEGNTLPLPEDKVNEIMKRFEVMEDYR